MKQKPSDHQAHYLPIGMCLGISIGTALGIAANNLPVYMAIGSSIGLCIGTLLDGINRKDTTDNSDAEPDEDASNEARSDE